MKLSSLQHFCLFLILVTLFLKQTKGFSEFNSQNNNSSLIFRNMVHSSSAPLNLANIDRWSNVDTNLESKNEETKNETHLNEHLKRFQPIPDYEKIWKNCINQNDIKECDSRLSEDFAIGVDFIYREQDCEKVASYQKCIDSVSESCWEGAKEETKSILYSRVIGVENICGFKRVKNISSIVKHIDLKEELKSTLDVMLENSCRSLVKPLVFVCIDQFQSRIDHFFETINHDFQDFEESPKGMTLCCAMLEYSQCLKVIINVKCDHKIANHVYSVVQSMQNDSSPHICTEVSYESKTCQTLLYSSAISKQPYYFTLIVALITTLYKLLY